MNIKKKTCWNTKGENGKHIAKMSFVFILSTVGVSPRKQTTTKSIATCSDCLPLLMSFNRPESASEAMLMDSSIADAIETLTGKRIPPRSTVSAARLPDAFQSAQISGLKQALSIVGRHAARTRWSRKKK